MCFVRWGFTLSTRVAFCMAIVCGAIVGCGGGGSEADAPTPVASAEEPIKGADANLNGIRDSIEAALLARFGGDQAQMKFASALGVQAERLLSPTPLSAEAAKEALTLGVSAVVCARGALSDRTAEEVRLEVWRLTFDTQARRQRLREMLDAAGAFPLAIDEAQPC